MYDNQQFTSPEFLSRQEKRIRTIDVATNNLTSKLGQQFQKAHDLNKAESLYQQASLEAERLLSQDLHLERNLSVVAEVTPAISNYPIEVKASPGLDINAIRQSVDESLAA
jgi:hypothetical protein